MKLEVGQVWASLHWVVLVLETADKPPEQQRQWYLMHRSELATRMAESPHVFCLVLADDHKSWPAGGTRWLEVNYVRGNAKRIG